MPIEFAMPKYAQIVNAVQTRITDGTYQPGTMIPSESQLMAEFTTSRPTVVRALGILQQDGWIESRAGVGRFVRARVPALSPELPDRAAQLFTGDDAAGVKLLKVGPVLSSPRAANALALKAGTPVIARDRLVVAEIGPVELVTTYIPVELAAQTDLGTGIPLREPLLEHLTTRAGVEFTHATERISARSATDTEAQLLDISAGDPVLTVLVSVFDTTGTPRVAIDAILPPTRQELEDAFPV